MWPSCGPLLRPPSLPPTVWLASPKAQRPRLVTATAAAAGGGAGGGAVTRRSDRRIKPRAGSAVAIRRTLPSIHLPKRMQGTLRPCWAWFLGRSQRSSWQQSELKAQMRHEINLKKLI